jgi:hypothetical protein
MPLRAHDGSSTIRSVAGRAALLLASSLAMALAAAGGTARADSPIEGVWSFNGGKVAIQGQADGAFTGTVVAPTKFAQCTHPVGEQMWTEMRRQGDGSYWGLHRWFFATDECIPNPALGPSAWRVLQTANKSRFLRACFSEPGSDSQPTIAPDGAARGATFGCVDSALISALPDVSTAQFGRYVRLPSNKSCLRRRVLRIRLRDPRNDPLKKVVVKLRSGKVRRAAKLTRHGRTVTAKLNLRGLPAGPFTVTIRLRTVLGNHLSGRRTYRRCAAKRRHKHGIHPHRHGRSLS